MEHRARIAIFQQPQGLQNAVEEHTRSAPLAVSKSVLHSSDRLETSLMWESRTAQLDHEQTAAARERDVFARLRHAWRTKVSKRPRADGKIKISFEKETLIDNSCSSNWLQRKACRNGISTQPRSRPHSRRDKILSRLFTSSWCRSSDLISTAEDCHKRATSVSKSSTPDASGVCRTKQPTPVNLTDDLERIMGHAAAVQGVDTRASQAQQRWEELVGTRARNTILEYQNQMRVDSGKTTCCTTVRSSTLLWQCCNPKDLEWLRASQYHEAACRKSQHSEQHISNTTRELQLYCNWLFNERSEDILAESNQALQEMKDTFEASAQRRMGFRCKAAALKKVQN